MLARQPTSAIIQPTTLAEDRDSFRKLPIILFLLKKSSAEGDTADYTIEPYRNLSLKYDYSLFYLKLFVYLCD